MLEELLKDHAQSHDGKEERDQNIQTMSRHRHSVTGLSLIVRAPGHDEFQPVSSVFVQQLRLMLDFSCPIPIINQIPDIADLFASRLQGHLQIARRPENRRQLVQNRKTLIRRLRTMLHFFELFNPAPVLAQMPIRSQVSQLPERGLPLTRVRPPEQASGSLRTVFLRHCVQYQQQMAVGSHRPLPAKPCPQPPAEDDRNTPVFRNQPRCGDVR